MKIALICPEFPPQITGGGGVVYELLAKRYARCGHDVTVIAADFDGSCPREEHRDGFVIRRYNLFRTPAQANYLLSVMPPTPASALRLWRDLRSQHFDAAHLHGYALPFIDFASAALGHRAVQLLTIHGFPISPFSKAAPIPQLYRSYLRLCASATLRRAQVISMVSEHLLRQRNLIGITPVVVNNGIDVRPWPYAWREDSVKSQTILCVGRLAYDKGFQDVIRAIPRLAAFLPNINLRIVGADHGFRAQLETIAGRVCNGRVVFAGSATPDGVRREMASAAVLAMPSHEEPFGLVALEAMASGTPIVASDAGALPSIVRNRIDGILFKAGEPDALAEAVLEILTNAELRTELRSNARARAESFSWDDSVSRYLQLLSGTGPAS